MTCSMNSRILSEVHEDGIIGSNLVELDEAPQSLHKAPREDGEASSDPTDRPGMRFAFLIHPLSEQTKDLMALDRDGRLRRTWGRSDLLEFCAEAHAAFGAGSKPIPDVRPRGPRVADTLVGLVSSTGARRKGASTRSRWMRGRS